MKCKICKKDYPSKYYFEFFSYKFPCNECIKNGFLTEEILREGLSDLGKINNTDHWYNQLCEKKIIKNSKLLEFIKSTIFLYKNSDKKMFSEDENMKISIKGDNLIINFPQEKLSVIFWVFPLFFFMFLPIHFLIKILLLPAIFLFIFNFIKFYLTTGKTIKVDHNYLRIHCVNENTLFKKIKNYKFFSSSFNNINIKFTEIEKYSFFEYYNRFIGKRYILMFKGINGVEYKFGYTMNKDFAENIINYFNKIL